MIFFKKFTYMVFFVFLHNGKKDTLLQKLFFFDFFFSLDVGAQRKIAYVIDILKTQQRPGTNFVKHIREGIFELRAQHNGNIYRAFFIFDEGDIVMLFNGFQKKTQKTPENEIEKAIILKNEYYAEKSE